eukprot:798470-Amphidinium_carterae.1
MHVQMRAPLCWVYTLCVALPRHNTIIARQYMLQHHVVSNTASARGHQGRGHSLSKRMRNVHARHGDNVQPDVERLHGSGSERCTQSFVVGQTLSLGAHKLFANRGPSGG